MFGIETLTYCVDQRGESVLDSIVEIIKKLILISLQLSFVVGGFLRLHLEPLARSLSSNLPILAVMMIVKNMTLRLGFFV